MTETNVEQENLEVDELVVLSKFDGDSTDSESEVERVTVHNGEVVSHEIIENGEVVGPVPNSTLVGQDLGYLTQETKEGGN
jgi:hypothetical protein